MKTYYKDSWVTIYHADCMDVLDDISDIDLLLTDPPYGVDGGSGTMGKHRSSKHNYKSYSDTLENVINNIVPRFEAYRIRSDASILTPGTKAMCHYPNPDSFGCFYQPATCGMQRWGRTDAQPIFYYGKDPRQGKAIQFSSYQLTEIPEDNGHPCPKPLKAWSKMLVRGSLEGDVVLDPFMGSGTTLRAAKDLGRKAIGIEICEEYCEIAAKRMAQEVLSLPGAED